jgi:hypothetical protein
VGVDLSAGRGDAQPEEEEEEDEDDEEDEWEEVDMEMEVDVYFEEKDVITLPCVLRALPSNGWLAQERAGAVGGVFHTC